MILVDLNQVMLSNLLMQLGNHTNAQLEENMVRYMILNSIRSYKHMFGLKYGEMIIACDNTNYWRKQLFPYYKANRKKHIEKSELDWKAIFECMNKIRVEIKEYFPYRVIDVESAEADDVIATLVDNFGACDMRDNSEPILILSGDKDFIQLHTFMNVEQYDPTRKKWIHHDDPRRYLKEHIMKGDVGDGIPNILSSDNCFVIGERQKPLTTKRIDNYINKDLSEYESNVLRNYHRNKELIDLTFIPTKISKQIMEQYDNQQGKDRSKLMGYFIKNKLRNLIEHLPEF